MKVARALIDGAARVLIIDDEGAWLVADPHADPLAVLAAGTGERSGTVDPSTLRWLPPVARPGKIVAVGLNYVDHTAETGFTPPAVPLTFAKYPSSLVGHGEDVIVPDDLTSQVDYEVELAAVIGRRCGGGDRPTIEDVIAYTVANDVCARDLQFSDGQWTRAKSFDTFTPLGPWLVSADEFGDPHAARIRTVVDGEVLQDDTTGSMVFRLEELLAHIGAGVTLEPGDIILTGTPAGAGGFRTPPRYLEHGAVVEVSVDGIGALRNRIVHRTKGHS